MNKRLLEIMARKAELRKELDDASQERLAAIQEETTALIAEEAEIRSRMDLAGKLGNPEPKPAEGNAHSPDPAEERAQKLVDTGRMVISSTEARSVLLSTGSLAKPTEVGGINEPQNILSSIVDMVTVEDLNGVGSYKEAYMTAWQTAGAGTDGTAPDPNDPGFRTVAINPFQVDTMTYVSKNLRKQTPLAYEEKVRKGAMIALKKKVVNYIIKGNGSTQPFGIYNAVNTEEVPEGLTQELLLTSSTLDATTLRKIVFAYGGDENIGGGARLFLNKDDLIAFGDIRGTNEKKAVYEIIPDGANPNTGIIKDGGLSVPYVICSDVAKLSGISKGVSKTKTMIYGDPGAYKLGLFGDYEVAVSEDYKFGEGLLTVKGEVMVGGNVVVDKGFVVVTLAAQ